MALLRDTCNRTGINLYAVCLLNKASSCLISKMESFVSQFTEDNFLSTVDFSVGLENY